MSTSPAAGSDPRGRRLLEIYQSGLSFRETIDAVLAALAEGQGWQAAALWVPDHHQHSMIGAGVWTEGPAHERFAHESLGAALPIDSTAVGRCYRSRQPLWIDDVETADGFLRHELVLDSGLRTVSLMPVASRTDTLGVLEFLGRGVTTAQRRHLELTEQVLAGLAGLLETQISAERIRMQQNRLELALEAGRMGTWEWDQRTDHLAWSPTLEQIFGFEPGSFPGTLEAYRERVHPDDLDTVDELLGDLAEQPTEQHTLHRIVRPDGQVRWVESHGRPFVAGDVGLVGMTGILADVTDREQALEDLARQVELTELALDDRTRVADTLQRSLRPDRLPSIEGLELVSGFRPGRELVGGDFYDVFTHGDDVYLCLGDVCGSGAPAAALTGLTRHAVRGLVTAGVRESDAVVAHLNELLVEEDLHGRFVTLVLGRLEPAGSGLEIELCRAGHPVPALRRRDGTAEWCEEAPGPIVGVFGDASWETRVVGLAPGDTLFLYTDGVTEARCDGDLFGEERLLRTLAAAPDGARALIAHVLAAVEGFDEGRSRDDIALLAVTSSG